MVVGGGLTSAGVVGGAVVGVAVAVAVGVAVGRMRDGVTWTIPGVRVGTGVGAGGVFLQPAMMSTRPRIATIQSRLMLAQCLMNFLLHIVRL